jgi:hypothetical protein
VVLAWLWAKVKLLIPGAFLALVLALAFADSKGLLGFGGCRSAELSYLFSAA